MNCFLRAQFQDSAAVWHVERSERIVTGTAVLVLRWYLRASRCLKLKLRFFLVKITNSDMIEKVYIFMYLKFIRPCIMLIVE